MHACSSIVSRIPDYFDVISGSNQCGISTNNLVQRAGHFSRNLCVKLCSKKFM